MILFSLAIPMETMGGVGELLGPFKTLARDFVPISLRESKAEVSRMMSETKSVSRKLNFVFIIRPNPKGVTKYN